MEQSWAGDGLGVGGGYSLLYRVFKVSGGRAGGIAARGSLRAGRGRPQECPLGMGRAGSPWGIWAEPNPDVLCQLCTEIPAPTLPRGTGSGPNPCCQNCPLPKNPLGWDSHSPAAPSLAKREGTDFGRRLGTLSAAPTWLRGTSGDNEPPGQDKAPALPGLGSCYLSAEGPRGCRSSGYPGRSWQCPARSPPAVSPRPRRQRGPGGCGSRLGSGLGEGAGGWNEGEVGGQGGWRPSPWQRGGLFSIRREGMGAGKGRAGGRRATPAPSLQVDQIRCHPEGPRLSPVSLLGRSGASWRQGGLCDSAWGTGSALPWVPPPPTVSWAAVACPGTGSVVSGLAQAPPPALAAWRGLQPPLCPPHPFVSR